jgi:tetratricopeptide (TPR) repeat protein
VEKLISEKTLRNNFLLILLFALISHAGTFRLFAQLEKGDALHKARDLKGALEAYEKVLKEKGETHEIAWRLSRTYSDLGELEAQKKIKTADFEQALKWAQKAIELNPQGPQGHLYLAIAYGRTARAEGPKEQIRLSKLIKEEAEKTLELDPKEHIAWHILGCWHRELSTLNWAEKGFANLFLGGVPKDASLEQSVICLKKAVEINPDVIVHHLELGITYQALDEKQLAVQEFKQVQVLPVYDSQDEIHQKEARQRLDKLED